jgi:hypothetical protein
MKISQYAIAVLFCFLVLSQSVFAGRGDGLPNHLQTNLSNQNSTYRPDFTPTPLQMPQIPNHGMSDFAITDQNLVSSFRPDFRPNPSIQNPDVYFATYTPPELVKLDWSVLNSYRPMNDESTPTPYPKNGSEYLPEILDMALAPALRANEQGNLFELTEQISQIEIAIENFKDTKDIESKESAAFLEKEIRRLFVDSKGLLKRLPHVSVTDAYLMTTEGSVTGATLRKNLNNTLITESIIAGECEAGGSSVSESCGIVLNWLEELKMSYYLSDRLWYTRSSNAPEYAAQLEKATQFGKGFAIGLLQGTVSLVTGLPQMVLQLPELASGIYHALRDLPRTQEAIREYVKDKWEQILNADVEEMGKITGEVIIQVATIYYVPVAITRVPQFTKGLSLALTNASVKVAAKAAEANGKITKQFKVNIKNLAKKDPFVAKEMLIEVRAGRFSEGVFDSAMYFKPTEEVFKLFTSAEKSIEHFVKHSNEVRQALGKDVYTFGEYMADANHVIKTGTFIPERNAFVKIIGGEGSAKAAFVGVEKGTEAITTFHIKTVKEISKIAPSLGWSK